MIRYRHGFDFPMPWDDFKPEGCVAPSFTLMTAEEYGGGEMGDEPGFEDGWWNLVLMQESITPDLAKEAMAAVLGVSPDEIEFAAGYA